MREKEETKDLREMVVGARKGWIMKVASSLKGWDTRPGVETLFIGRG